MVYPCVFQQNSNKLATDQCHQWRDAIDKLDCKQRAEKKIVSTFSSKTLFAYLRVSNINNQWTAMLQML